LRQYVTDGEWEDIKADLPRDLADIVPV
jgi:hypothetical protein